MYVYQLASELLKQGHECLLLSLSDTKISDSYEDIQIKYIPFVDKQYSVSENPANKEAFIQIVKEYQPDIVHLHTGTPSLGILHLTDLGAMGIKTVFTSHLPGITCLRGDLLLYGKEVCDGYVSQKRCVACYLHKQNYSNSLLRNIIIYMASKPHLHFINSSLPVYDNKVKSLGLLKSYMDHVVLVSEWQRKVFKLNGFKEDKTSVCRQAVFKDYIKEKSSEHGGVLKIGFAGRVVKVKALHLLIEAIVQASSDSVELHVAAIKAENEADYYSQIKSSLSKIKHVWKEDLGAEDMKSFLDELDILAIPSTILETGPYVAFEALARKVPVLAFNKGGVAELIEHSKNGWLFDDMKDWSNLIKELSMDKQSIREMSARIDMRRTTKDIYNEMMLIYQSVLKKKIN